VLSPADDRTAGTADPGTHTHEGRPSAAR